MQRRKHEDTHEEENVFFFVLSCFRGPGAVLAVVLWLSPAVLAATKAIRAGKAIDPNGKVIASAARASAERQVAWVG